MSLFEFWTKKKKREEVLQRSRERELSPSDLKRLLTDSGVREALSGSSVASLLPPVGSQVFRRFTAASQEENQRRFDEEEERKRKKSDQEASHSKPANQLRAGKTLPFFYGDPPAELLNTPLEELDPYYQSQKTFLILGKGNIIRRFHSGDACFLFSPLHPLRTWAIRLLHHSFFRLFIIATILTNSVFMVMKDPPAWSYKTEWVFLAIYLLEVIIKLMSQGACFGKFTFLRDPWNWLDVLVIFTMALGSVDKIAAVSCALRVLKLFPLIPGMRSTVTALVQSGKRLLGVTVMTMVSLSIFALISQQCLMGRLRNSCVMWPVNFTAAYLDNGTRGFDYHQYMQNDSNYYFHPGNLDSLLCGNGSDAGSCPEGFTCMKGHKNPNYGYTSFDWIGPSLLSIMRIFSHSFWDNLVMLVLRSSGMSYIFLFVILLFPGCFFLLSLIVAVVAMAIGKQEKSKVAEAQMRNKEYIQIQRALKKSNKEEQALSETEDDTQKISKKQDSTVEDSSCSSCCLGVNNGCLKWNCCGCWRWLKRHLYTFVSHPLFDLGIIICLIINIVFMAMEHYPMSYDFEFLLALTHLIFLFIFLVEMLLKIVAMDPYGYFKDGWNILESAIVVFGILEMVFADISSFSLLRSLRLLRVFRLAKWWPSFRLFLKMIWFSLSTLRNLTLALLITVFMFSVLGMRLFQNDYKDFVCKITQDCELPRWHMNDFFHTFLLVFRALLGDWAECLWDCMEVSNPAMCVIFFTPLVIMGHLLLLGLFLTLLLSWASSFMTVSQQTQEKDLKPIVVQISRAFRGLRGQDLSATDKKDDNGTDGLALDVVTSEQVLSEVPSSGGEISQKPDIESQSAPIAEIEEELKTPKNKDTKGDDGQKHPEEQPVQHAEEHEGNILEDCCCAGCYRCCPLLDLNKSQSLGKFWFNFRRTCLSIVQHQAFEAFIILIIVLSSIALVFEDIYMPQRRIMKMVVETGDQVFTFIFLLEMLLKWSALGLKKYFTDAWCLLDFLILNVSLACFMDGLLGFSALGAAICTLRALMPLRIINRIKGLRVVVHTAFRSLPSVLNAFLVLLIFWLVFSIIGVNLYAGKFFYCFNETSESYFLPEQVDNKSECFALMLENFTEIRWKNIHLTFDNVMSGYLSLFVMAASYDWFDILYAITDAREIEEQPTYENNEYGNLYFVFFIIATFFSLNFIVGAIICSLQKDWSEGKPLFATRNQMMSMKALKTRLSRKPHFPVPKSSCRVWLYNLVTNKWFEVFMVVVICLNMVVLMVDGFHATHEVLEILHWFDFTFILIFLVEFILKIIPLGRHYYTSCWNIVDFVVLVMMIAGLFLADLVEKYFISPTLFQVLRLPRIFKVINLIPRTKGNKKLLWALLMSLPSVFNIGLLFFVLTFSFSVFGMFNFAHVKQGANLDMFNFETFWSSLVSMLLASPSSSFYGLLLPITKGPPDCDPYAEHPGLTVLGNCGNPIVGIVFFVTFITLSIFMLFYLYMAVILEVFYLESSEQLSDRDLTMFYNTWRKFDPEASRCIKYSELSDFCSALKDPLRIPKPNSIRLTHMDLPILPGDKIHCEDVLLALSSQGFSDPVEEDRLRSRLEKKFTSTSPKVSCEPISSTLQRKHEEVAATVIQRAFRKCHQPHGDAEGAGQSDGGTDGSSGV